MLKFLSRLFEGPRPTHEASRPQVGEGPQVWQEQREPGSLVAEGNEGALDHFWSQIGHLSHARYRFLHPTYSPTSRIPCADFTPFIVDRLRHGDLRSIQRLMRAVLAGNPCLGAGPEWIDQAVHDIVEIDFDRFCQNTNADFVLELQALFILGTKDGGGSEFWITDDFPVFVASALCCHEIRWRSDLEELRERANRFIRRMRVDTPFWETYPLFDRVEVDDLQRQPSPLVGELCKLSPLTRVHLLDFADKGVGSLMRSTSYKMRSVGLNPLQTAPALLGSGICELTDDREALSFLWSKDELLSLLEARRIPCRKSWNKTRLLETLATQAPEVVAEAIDREKIARIRPDVLSETRSLRSYADALRAPMALLCFAKRAT